jgi:hypothetical protein
VHTPSSNGLITGLGPRAATLPPDRCVTGSTSYSPLTLRSSSASHSGPRYNVTLKIRKLPIRYRSGFPKKYTANMQAQDESRAGHPQSLRRCVPRQVLRRESRLPWAMQVRAVHGLHAMYSVKIPRCVGCQHSVEVGLCLGHVDRNLHFGILRFGEDDALDRRHISVVATPGDCGV